MNRAFLCCDTQGFRLPEFVMDSVNKAIKDWLKQHQISEVECLVPDMTGNARGKFIPAHQSIEEKAAALSIYQPII